MKAEQSRTKWDKSRELLARARKSLAGGVSSPFRARASVVMSALDQGIYLLPDGRIYVSAVHGESDIDESVASVDRACANL